MDTSQHARMNLPPHPLCDQGFAAFPMVPFSLLDRPNHFRVLRLLDLHREYPEVPLGIMTHANITAHVQELIRAFPCDLQECVDVLGRPCPFRQSGRRCPYHTHIRRRTIIMCDSGAFTREGAALDYPQLFEVYRRMGVDYGVMADILHDAAATLESAKRALSAYAPFSEHFRLVAVAQGANLDDYVRCYQALKDLGCTYVALGGLLTKVAGSARFTHVQCEEFMWQVISAVRALYSQDWLFALGALHPRRIPRLVQYRVWADSKRWLFQYERAATRFHTRLTEPSLPCAE